MSVYTGHYDDINWYNVKKDGVVFDHTPSLEVRNHSPDGFAWGYAGSGPAQLALAILLEETKNIELSQIFYQDFKLKVILNLNNKEKKGVLWEFTSGYVKFKLKSIIRDYIELLETKDKEEIYMGESVDILLCKFKTWLKEL